MNRVTPPIRQFATRLIIHEMGENASSTATPSQTFQVLQKLRPQLETLMGNGGFHALLLRALALSSPQVPWLHAVRVNADGTLEEGDKQAKPIEPKPVVEGSSVLIAELLGLMVAFVGAAITLQLVREVWPEMQLKDSVFSDEEII